MKLLIAAATAMLAGPAMAATTIDVPVDLSGWTRQGAGTWNLQPGNNAVLQTVNTATPTVFFGPGNAQGTRLSGTIRVNTTADDDFIGFVLGFKSGDLTATSTDFLLLDWKQNTQPSGGCSGNAGLAISRVTAGLGANSGAWCHSSSFGVNELARGATLGSTGWADNTTYTFDIDFQPNNVTVSVDGVQQFDLDGTFANGAFGFYNYSQQSVLYAGITSAVLPDPTIVPEPGTWAMLIAGFGLVGAAQRRRRRAAA